MCPDRDDPSILDARFREAVAALDAGDVAGLRRLLGASPELACARLEAPGAWLRDAVGGAVDGFFRRPFLLWFVAEDPVRNGRLPGNVAEAARAIVGAARRACPSTLPEQLDHALTLVSWSWIARDCGVQLALIDALIDEGAAPGGNANEALVNGNTAAAEHLVARGAALTLASALCLDRWADVDRLLPAAGERERRFALVLAALNGRVEAVRRLLAAGVDPNARSEDLYPHGTPLHHAVASGSLDAVRALVGAGADPDATDAAWSATPLGWAEHYLREGQRREGRRGDHEGIAAYLRARGGG